MIFILEAKRNQNYNYIYPVLSNAKKLWIFFNKKDISIVFPFLVTMFSQNTTQISSAKSILIR